MIFHSKRIAALLLVSCLVADPTTARAIVGGPFSESPVHSEKALGQVNPFADQAFMLRIVDMVRPLGRFMGARSLMSEEAQLAGSAEQRAQTVFDEGAVWINPDALPEPKAMTDKPVVLPPLREIREHPVRGEPPVFLSANDLQKLKALLRSPAPQAQRLRVAQIARVLGWSNEPTMLEESLLASLATTWLLIQGPGLQGGGTEMFSILNGAVFDNPSNADGLIFCLSRPGALRGAPSAWYPPLPPKSAKKDSGRRRFLPLSPWIVLDASYALSLAEAVDLLKPPLDAAFVERHFMRMMHFISSRDFLESFQGLLLAERLWFHEAAHQPAGPSLEDQRREEARVMGIQKEYDATTQTLFGHQSEREAGQRLGTVEFIFHLLREYSPALYKKIASPGRYRVLRGERLGKEGRSIDDWIAQVYTRLEPFGLAVRDDGPPAWTKPFERLTTLSEIDLLAQLLPSQQLSLLMRKMSMPRRMLMRAGELAVLNPRLLKINQMRRWNDEAALSGYLLRLSPEVATLLQDLIQRARWRIEWGDRSPLTFEQRLAALSAPACRIVARVVRGHDEDASVSADDLTAFMNATWNPEADGIAADVKAAILADANYRARTAAGRKTAAEEERTTRKALEELEHLVRQMSPESRHLTQGNDALRAKTISDFEAAAFTKPGKIKRRMLPAPTTEPTEDEIIEQLRQWWTEGYVATTGSLSRSPPLKAFLRLLADVFETAEAAYRLAGFPVPPSYFLAAKGKSNIGETALSKLRRELANAPEGTLTMAFLAERDILQAVLAHYDYHWPTVVWELTGRRVTMPPLPPRRRRERVGEPARAPANGAPIPETFLEVWAPRRAATAPDHVRVAVSGNRTLPNIFEALRAQYPDWVRPGVYVLETLDERTYYGKGDTLPPNEEALRLYTETVSGVSLRQPERVYVPPAVRHSA